MTCSFPFSSTFFLNETQLQITNYKNLMLRKLKIKIFFGMAKLESILVRVVITVFSVHNSMAVSSGNTWRTDSIIAQNFRER